MNSGELLQLIYISDVNPELAQQDLDLIHQQAERNNTRFNITGLLLVTNKHFMQLLEGDARKVQARFAKIAADPRHHNVRQISLRTIAQRQFPDWHMGLKRLLDQDEHLDLSAVINLYGQQHQFSGQHAEAISMLFRSI